MDTLPNWFIPVITATGVVAVAVFIKAYRYVHEYRNIFKEMGLQEVPAEGWLGSWSDYTKVGNGDLFPVEIEFINKHGKIFGYFEGRYPVIMAADPDLVKHVAIKDHASFVDRRQFIRAKKRHAMGLFLTVLTGQRWKHVRQQLTPAFTPSNLRRMEPLLNKVADQLVDNIAKQANANASFNIKEYAGCFTMDAIASVAFAMEIDSFNNPNNPFVTHAKNSVGTIPLNGKFLTSLLLFPDQVSWLMSKVPLNKLPFGKTFAFFREVIEGEVTRRKNNEQQVQRNDFLAQVIPLEKDPNDPANQAFVEKDDQGSIWLRNGITRDELMAQAVLFFIAGYETTGSSIASTLLLLCEHPDIQEKLYQELATAFAGGKQMTFEALNEVQYLEMVISESLRYYSPVLRFDRMCTNDTEYNGMRIPKGVTVVVPVNALHHDPDLWSDPEKFDPERFSPENIERVPQMGYCPFGLGNRNCIGMRLAMLEMKLAIARLIFEFKFTLAPETLKQMPMRWLPTGLRTPSCGIYLCPERRKAPSSS